MNKRGIEAISEVVSYILINILFIAILTVFIYNSSSNNAFEEKIIARKIALMIDSMDKGGELRINLENIQLNAEIKDLSISIDLVNNRVIASISGDSGQGYSFFTKVSQVSGDGRREIIIKND